MIGYPFRVNVGEFQPGEKEDWRSFLIDFFSIKDVL